MNFPLDKQAHALGGAVIVLVASYFVPLLMCLAICLALALGKEIYDNQHPDKHTTDVWDFVATALGGLVAASFIWVVA